MSKGSDKAKYSRALFYYGINTVIISIIGFVANLLFVRYFGVKIFGQYTLLLSFISIFFSVSTLGLLSGIGRETAWYVSKKKNVGNFVLTIFIIILLASFLFSYPSVNYARQIIETKYNSPELFSPLISLGLIHLFIIVPAALLQIIFECYREIFPTLIVNSFSGFIRISLLAMSSICGFTLINAIIINYAVPNLIIFICLLIISIRFFKIKIDRKKNSETILHTKNVIIYSIKLLPVAFSELIIANTAFIIIGQKLSFESLGEYKVVYSIFTILSTFPILFGKVLFPTLSKLYFDEEYSSIYNYFKISLKVCISIFIPIIIVGIAFSKELLGIYEINNNAANYSLLIMLIANLIMAGSFVGSLLAAYNKPEKISLFLIFGAIVNLIFCIILIPKFGIIGASVSSLLGYLTTQVFVFRYSQKLMKKNLPIQIILKPLINGLVMLIAILLIKIGFDHVYFSVLSIIIGSTIYISLSIYFNPFTMEDIKNIREILNSINNNLTRKLLMKILNIIRYN